MNNTELRVRSILEDKGTTIWSVSPNATVLEALQILASRNIGALLVIEDGEIAGIFTERDYARKIILENKKSRDTPVREVMSRRVRTVSTEHSVEECMTIMTDKRIRHLPVMEDEKLVGIISIGDVVKTLLQEQQFIIEQLEGYITGGR